MDLFMDFKYAVLLNLATTISVQSETSGYIRGLVTL